MTPDVLALASACLLIVSLVGLLILKLIRGGKTSPPSSTSSDADAAAAARAKSDAEDVDVKLRVALYYGTQTGTSERFARETEEEIKRRYGKHVKVRTTDLAGHIHIHVSIHPHTPSWCIYTRAYM